MKRSTLKHNIYTKLHGVDFKNPIDQLGLNVTKEEFEEATEVFTNTMVTDYPDGVWVEMTKTETKTILTKKTVMD